MTTNEKRTAILAAMADACIANDHEKHPRLVESARSMIADCVRQLRYFQPGTPEHNAELREGLDIARDAATVENSDGLGIFDLVEFHAARKLRFIREMPTVDSSREFLADLVTAGLVTCDDDMVLGALYTIQASPCYADMAVAYHANEEARAHGRPASFMPLS